VAERDPYAPIKGKCVWWREFPNDEDRYDPHLKEDQKRVYCSCFVEGRGWTFPRVEVPRDCPDSRKCRYYIRNT
jgi:hypothetical protein